MQPEKFLEHFSNHLKNAIARGISIAATLESDRVMPLHLLIALGEEPGSMSQELLARFNVSRNALTPFLDRLKGSRANMPGQTATIPELSEAAKQALEKAMMIAYEHAQNHVGTEHLLIGILDLDEETVDEALRSAGVNRDALEDDIDALLHGGNLAPEPVAPDTKINPNPAKKGKIARPVTALDVFTTDLTAKHVQNRLDPVIGRAMEIDRMMRILARRNKNNPVLVGEPGVGKTALVEGLAKKIAAGDVPEILRRKKIRSLDLTLLLAGTMYRGEFEARLKQIIEEVAHRDDTILFIDEIHNIIGAGSNSGTMDAANILKPALARGVLRCIGATTVDEYQKHIGADPALERRFQSIVVEEPSRDDAIAMILGTKTYYERFHAVEIGEDAVRAAVDLSMRYIHDNYLPDKAIDLIDEASAAVNLGRPASSPRKKRLSTAPTSQVSKSDIADIVARRLRLSASDILRSDHERLTGVGAELKAKIIGQEEVIDELIRGLRQAYFRLGRARKPLASYLFVGPSGVGKTALSRALATALYHDEKACIKFDMTEFSEQHSVSKILGSPAGYVGYKERNRFTDELKKRPHAVLVFDEYDKAHADVQKLLFQILDEGELTDSQGKKIYFHHAIIILTTNIGAELYDTRNFGFERVQKNADETRVSDEMKKRVEGKLKDFFGSALLSRIGHILFFRGLTDRDRKRIVEQLFAALAEELKKQKDVSIVPDPVVVETLILGHKQSDSGVRELERRVERLIEDATLEALEKSRRRKKYTLTLADGAYRLR